MLANGLGDRHAVPALDALHRESTDVFFAASSTCSRRGGTVASAAPRSLS